MRINVYTEELSALLLDEHGHAESNSGIMDEHGRRVCEIVTADYVSSRTGQPMTNYGLRIYLRSPPELHYVLHADGAVRDDDRSAVTFWCGPRERNVLTFLNTLMAGAQYSTLELWHKKTEKVQAAAEKAGWGAAI